MRSMPIESARHIHTQETPETLTSDDDVRNTAPHHRTPQTKRPITPPAMQYQCSFDDMPYGSDDDIRQISVDDMPYGSDDDMRQRGIDQIRWRGIDSMRWRGIDSMRWRGIDSMRWRGIDLVR
jgi:hypothetical protein